MANPEDKKLEEKANERNATTTPPPLLPAHFHSPIDLRSIYAGLQRLTNNLIADLEAIERSTNAVACHRSPSEENLDTSTTHRH